jgi:hypothetical protein
MMFDDATRVEGGWEGDESRRMAFFFMNMRPDSKFSVEVDGG